MEWELILSSAPAEFNFAGAKAELGKTQSSKDNGLARWASQNNSQL